MLKYLVIVGTLVTGTAHPAFSFCYTTGDGYGGQTQSCTPDLPKPPDFNRQPPTTKMIDGGATTIIETTDGHGRGSSCVYNKYTGRTIC